MSKNSRKGGSDESPSILMKSWNNLVVGDEWREEVKSNIEIGNNQLADVDITNSNWGKFLNEIKQNYYNSFYQRRLFILNWKDLIWTKLCNKLFQMFTCNNFKKFKRHNSLFKQGEAKLNSEIDIVFLLNNIHKLKTITNLTLSKEQQDLLQFHNSCLIESESTKGKMF